MVTGAIGAGATTLAQLLIHQLKWAGYLEGPIEQDNPFLGDAYRDFSRWGFHSQTHFLLSSVRRHDALRHALAEMNSAAPVIVEDRTPFEHTGAYLASYEKLGRIPAREASLLRDLTQVLERNYLPPDLLIYREMTPGQLTARVTERGRPGEEAADFELLETVRASFDEFIAGWDRSEKIIVPAEVDVLEPTVATSWIDHIVRTLERVRA